MKFTWKPKETTVLDTCFLKEENKGEDVVVLGCDRYKIAKVGCCGQARHDLIYPISNEIDYNSFYNNSIKMLKESSTNDDWYATEQFYGEPGQEFRPKDVYLQLIFELGSKWTFYKEGIEIFSFCSIKEFEILWDAFKK